ncbi:MAG: PDZ domain-containing protein [Gammaproteobacteria bacterium]|nr:PDZ domain-containing protein [Gammaproteobacteria bacterium]
MLRYRLYPENPFAHIFRLELEIQNPQDSGQILSLANWIPGSYLVRNFAKHIVSLSASSNGEEVIVTKLDKNHWQCEACSGPLLINYDIYAFDLSVRSAYLADERAFFNGTSVFLKAHEHEDKSCEIEIHQPPKSQTKGNWKIATTLEKLSESKTHSTFLAANYNQLIDHPVEMADYQTFDFSVSGTPHQMVLTGEHNADLDRLTADLELICQHHIDFFGNKTPFDRYLFLTLVVTKGFGGLEHADSTSLICSREDLQDSQISEPTSNYTRFISLCCHEYFHAWWVKKLRPAVFLKPDLNKEVFTEQLWIFEGFTSYYDELTLLRVKILSPDSYLSLFAKTVTRVTSGNGRLKQSIAESSFDAWTKFYQQDENAPNSIVSYYGKGALLAFVLDVEIRKATQDKVTLDDVLRYAYAHYSDSGLQDSDIAQIVDQLTGQPFNAFFEQYLYGVDELPLKEAFNYVGVDCQFGINAKDMVAFGVRVTNDNGSSKITQVLDDSCAQQSGLFVGDVVIAIDGVKVAHENLVSVINKSTSGATLEFAISRDQLMKNVSVKVSFNKESHCTLSLMNKPNSTTKARQKQWFYGVTG